MSEMLFKYSEDYKSLVQSLNSLLSQNSYEQLLKSNQLYTIIQVHPRVSPWCVVATCLLHHLCVNPHWSGGSALQRVPKRSLSLHTDHRSLLQWGPIRQAHPSGWLSHRLCIQLQAQSGCVDQRSVLLLRFCFHQANHNSKSQTVLPLLLHRSILIHHLFLWTGWRRYLPHLLPHLCSPVSKE